MEIKSRLVRKALAFSVSARLLCFVMPLTIISLVSSNHQVEAIDVIDNTPPIVEITSPSWCSDKLPANQSVTIRGIAKDGGTGIKRVEGFSHVYLTKTNFPYELATPDTPGNWSSWSIVVNVFENRTRVLIRAVDNAGNENWADIIIDPHKAELKPREGVADPIAFVEPSFTNGAYNVGGFYEFYAKYHEVKPGERVTSDLELFTADIPNDPDRSYFQPILNRVQDFVGSEVPVTVIGDMNVHRGEIFSDDGTNAYRALFLLHNEYVTQEEYDNLRRFVSNGGTLVLIDGNIFYAEVAFDEKACAVTLVEGHDWEFDGESGRRGVSERYFEQNREWIGSNYMINALWDPVTFANNPFNYTHFEENYVSNPEAIILYDFGLTIGENYESDVWHRNQTIATYELEYGGGKTVALGVYGQNVANNTEFLDFFEDIVLMQALGNRYDVQVDDVTYPVYWKMEDGYIHQITVDQVEKKIIITLDRPTTRSELLKIALPRALIDVSSPENDSRLAAGQSIDGMNNAEVLGFKILDDDGTGLAVRQTDQTVGHYARVSDVILPINTTRVEVQGAYVVPEFQLAAPILAASVIMIIVTVRKLRAKMSAF